MALLPVQEYVRELFFPTTVHYCSHAKIQMYNLTRYLRHLTNALNNESNEDCHCLLPVVYIAVTVCTVSPTSVQIHSAFYKNNNVRDSLYFYVN